jgi:hypothetical protein
MLSDHLVYCVLEHLSIAGRLPYNIAAYCSSCQVLVPSDVEGFTNSYLVGAIFKVNHFARCCGMHYISHASGRDVGEAVATAGLSMWWQNVIV